MNYSIVRHVVAWVIFFAGVFMLLPFLVGLYYREEAALVYLITGAVCIVIGLIAKAKPVKSKVFYAKEGFVATALCWIFFGLAGAVPFVGNSHFILMHYLKAFPDLLLLAQAF